MKKQTDETAAELRPEVAAKVAQHYAHARAKHPYFADYPFFHGGEECLAEATRTLEDARWHLNYEIEQRLVFADTVLNCELCEAAFALATGNKGHAVEECYDAIAVLLRIVDALEGRQPLGYPREGKEGE